VLHAASFLADEDSPSSSSGSKRSVDFNVLRSPGKPAAAATVASDPEDDEWALGSWHSLTVGPDAACDSDCYAYVAELVRLFLRRTRRYLDDVYEIAEQSRRRRRRQGIITGGDDDKWHHRRLLCGAVAEALDWHRSACPWDPASSLRGGELVDHVCAEVRRARELRGGEAEAEDLNDATCSAIRRDLLAVDGPWASTRRPGPEVADAVLQIERLVFKDVVADADRLVPRRRLVF
jgi:hypothetical protein